MAAWPFFVFVVAGMIAFGIQEQASILIIAAADGQSLLLAVLLPLKLTRSLPLFFAPLGRSCRQSLLVTAETCRSSDVKRATRMRRRNGG